MRNDEFMELIPTERKDATQHSTHKKKTDKHASDHDEHWHDAYIELYGKYHEYHCKMEKYCKNLESTIEKLQKIIAGYEEAIDDLRDSVSEEDDIDYTAKRKVDTPVQSKNYFQRGIGLDIRSGKEPKLYRLSDPDGTAPKRKFDGFTFELQPGRGFAISPKWKEV